MTHPDLLRYKQLLQEKWLEPSELQESKDLEIKLSEQLDEWNKLQTEFKRIKFDYDVWYDISNTISYGRMLERQIEELRKDRKYYYDKYIEADPNILVKQNLIHLDTIRNLNSQLKLDLDSPELLEKLASIEHFQWCRWALELMDKEDLSQNRIDRWTGMLVDYNKLPEEYKEFDRRFARLVVSALQEQT